jgi:hypothetical protein
MNKKQKRGWIIVWVLLALILTVENAYAYLDLGTGQYLLQMIVAGFLATIFTLRMYWGKFTSLIKNLFSKKKTE